MRSLYLLILALALPCAAQSIYVYPATSFPPRGDVQTVTAIVTGANNKTVTWTTNHGTLIGTNPCVVNEPCTIGVQDLTAETATVTATSNANGSVIGTASITFTASPTVSTTHPRFLYTPANLAAMQAKATGSNVMYQAMLSSAVSNYTLLNGIWSWSCGGGTGGSTGLPVPAVLFTATSYTVSAGAPGPNSQSQIVIQAANSITQTPTDALLVGFPGGLNNQYVYITSANSTTIVGNVKGQSPSSGTTGSVGLLQISGNSLVGSVEEVSASIFSNLGNLDPSDPIYHWPCYALDVARYVWSIMPLIGPNYGYFPVGENDWSDNSPAWSTLVDWVRGENTLSGGDLAIAQNFYNYLAYVVQGTYDTPNPAAVYNSPAMVTGFINNGTPTLSPDPSDFSSFQTLIGNNYNESKLLLLGTIPLSFDDNMTDAPNNTGNWNTCGATRYKLCTDGTAGSIRAYWPYETGALLYNYWSGIDDPNVVQQTYNTAYSNIASIPNCEAYDLQLHPCFGGSRDGASREGNGYSYAQYRLQSLCSMLYTSGNYDPLVNGPQMSACFSSWWDMKYVRDLEILTGPTSFMFNGELGIPIREPAYNPITMGDELNYFWYGLNIQTEANLLSFDGFTGRTDRASALEWINYNVTYGGPLGTAGGCPESGNQCGWVNRLSDGSDTVLQMFMVLPAGNPVEGALPPDPRPSLPTEFYDGSLNQNQMVRTGWGSTSTLFTDWFNNSQETHEYNYDGRFDVYSCLSGTCDYITKGRAIFNDYNKYMVSANLAQNELGILNSTGTPNSGDGLYPVEINGGQFSQQNFGMFSSSTHSELPTYAAAIGITTGSYNGEPEGYYDDFNDITAASRSIVFLKATNQVVYYDRAAVGHSASTQTLQQIATGTPTISGNTASWPTQSGMQKGIFTTLLPSGTTLTNTGLPCPSCNTTVQPTDWEPQNILQVTQSGTPLTSQWLSTLQWGASAFTPVTATLVQSTSGQGFDGAIMGTTCVMFERAYPLPFIGTTYPSSGCTTHYVSDLTPGAVYPITGTGTPANATADTAGVLVFAAAGTGKITVGASSSSGGTVYGSGVIISGGVVVQ